MKLFCYYRGENIFWFRLFGRGFCFKKRFSFSQRNGYSKFIKIGDCAITFLKK